MSEFQTIEKGSFQGALPSNIIGVDANGHMSLGVNTFVELNKPTAARLHTDGIRLGIEFSSRGDRDRDNFYYIQFQEWNGERISGQIHTDVTKETDLEYKRRYEIQYDPDTEFYIVDPEYVYSGGRIENYESNDE